MINKRILIISGGSISKKFIKEYLNEENFDIVIAVDSGLAVIDEMNISVHYIVGDFDSVSQELIQKYKENKDNTATVIKEYNPQKDATDTQIAIELAVELGAMEVVLLGATGTRIDHTIANIHLLNILLHNNIKGYILDEHNKVYLINQNITLVKNQLFGSYISLQPFTEEVEVTLQGFKYPLLKRNIKIGNSLGVSNEVVSEEANILLPKGILIVVESKD